jgi:hypothetical protein
VKFTHVRTSNNSASPRILRALLGGHVAHSRWSGNRRTSAPGVQHKCRKVPFRNARQANDFIWCGGRIPMTGQAGAFSPRRFFHNGTRFPAGRDKPDGGAVDPGTCLYGNGRNAIAGRHGRESGRPGVISPAFASGQYRFVPSGPGRNRLFRASVDWYLRNCGPKVCFRADRRESEKGIPP